MQPGRWLAMAVSLALISACGESESTDSTRAEPAVTPDRASTASTTNDGVAPELWGDRATEWWEAMGRAASEGSEHMVGFLAPEVVWEDRFADAITRTEDEWVDRQLAVYRGPFPWIDAAMLVSADELLGSFTMPMQNGLLAPTLDRMVIGPNGVRHWVTALDFEECRAHVPRLCEIDVDGVVDRYVGLWNGASHGEVNALYTPDAVISDSLLGESLSGAGAILELVGSESWPSIGKIVVPSISERSGRAVYLAPGSYGRVEGPPEIRFLLDADDGSGCPGRMGVALGLQGERVIWEHRYHDIDAVRECYEPSDLQPGWWDRMETPPTLAVEKTGTVPYDEQAIDVFNGAGQLDDFVRWGLSRFEAAGLAVPRIESVTFLRARVYCHDIAGRATTSEDKTSIVLCATLDDVCAGETCETWSGRTRWVWLHELSHAWLRQQVSDEVRSEFLELVELPSWSDADDPWSRRGVEIASDILAYGLMDEPVTLFPGGDPGDCELRDAGFECLTGVHPLAACSVADD